MKYVVTGGAGFIGSNLVDALVDSGHDVYVIDNFSSGKKANCNENASYLECDISNIKNIQKIKIFLDGADTIFHCAALARVQPSIQNPVKYESNNTLGLVNMLKIAVDKKVRRFVYSASSSAYGNTEFLPSKETDQINPMSPYANQKYYGELCCKMFSEVYNLETISLRYFNVYGERQNIGGTYATVIGIFLHQLQNNLPLTINGSGKQRRDFAYVGDVIRANILAANTIKIQKGEIINIGSGYNLSINDVAKMISDNFIYCKAVKEPFANLACIKKAKNLLDWEPKTNLESWIKKYKNE